MNIQILPGGKVQDGDITRVSHNEDAVEGLMGVVNCFNRLGRRHEEDTKTGDERGGWRKWLPRDRGARAGEYRVSLIDKSRH